MRVWISELADEWTILEPQKNFKRQLRHEKNIKHTNQAHDASMSPPNNRRRREDGVSD